MGTDPKEKDIYRDTLIRFLGYANEIGESLRRQIGPKLVAVTYGVSTLYALADTKAKSTQAFMENEGEPKRIMKTVYAGADTLIWQMLASVIISGYAINRICALTHLLLKRKTKFTPLVLEYATTAIGVSAIPIIYYPIDRFADLLLDSTIRKYAP